MCSQFSLCVVVSGKVLASYSKPEPHRVSFYALVVLCNHCMYMWLQVVLDMSLLESTIPFVRNADNQMWFCFLVKCLLRYVPFWIAHCGPFGVFTVDDSVSSQFGCEQQTLSMRRYHGWCTTRVLLLSDDFAEVYDTFRETELYKTILKSFAYPQV